MLGYVFDMFLGYITRCFEFVDSFELFEGVSVLMFLCGVLILSVLIRAFLPRG